MTDHPLQIRRTFSSGRTLFGLIIATLWAVPCGAQAHHDTIRGTVTTDSGKALAAADIIITMAPDRLSRATTTDSAGHYSMEFANGTGDYLVHISAVGYSTYRKRVTRVGSDSVFVVDATLLRTGVQQLAAVKVKAKEKPTPSREPLFGLETGASEQIAGGVNGAVSPDQAGDLAAIGATIPGIASTPAGLSVGGIGGQNSTTINGMAFAGADVPRDARTSVRVSSSTYDPARGWFGGLNENVELSSGSLFATRRAHVTLDAPVLQYTDPVSARMGQRFTNGIASFGGDGALDDDNFVYNYGLQAGRRSADAVSLSNAAPDLLQHAGVSADSAARLFNVLSAAGVPLRNGAVPSSHIMQNASFIARIDHAPYNWNTFQPARTSWGLLAYGKLASDNAAAISPTAVAAHGASTSQGIGMLQALFSTYLHGDYLNEERSGFTFSRNRSTPYLALPDGSVLVGSSFPDGTGGLTSLAFGGNSTMLSNTRQWTWETTSMTQFYAHGRETHRVKLDADSRIDGIRQETNANAFGSFAFNSLGELASNQPSSFTRSLNAPTLHGSVWNGYVALGDLWRSSSTFQVMYGARLEANHYLSAPEFNPAVQSTFGLRTDHAPNTVHLSPRIGFTWIRKPRGDRNHASTGSVNSISARPATYEAESVNSATSCLRIFSPMHPSQPACRTDCNH